MLTGMYARPVREEEQIISLQFVGSQSQQDVSNCRKKKKASRWWLCYSTVAYTALDLDCFLLKTWEPEIVDSRESLSLFHLLTPIGQRLDVVFGCVWERSCSVFGSCFLSLTFLFVIVVQQWQAIAQFNDCHCCNDARSSLVQKKERSTCMLGFHPLAFDWSFEEKAFMTLPSLSGRLQRGLVGVFLGFFAVASIGVLYPILQRHLWFFRSWQKGDRPDNGDVEPCSIQPKKNQDPSAMMFHRVYSAIGEAWRHHH